MLDAGAGRAVSPHADSAMKPSLLAAPLLLALLCLLPGGASAQTYDLPVEPGDRIRLASPTPGEEPVVATVVRRDPHWLAFTVQGEPDVVWSRRAEFLDSLAVRRPRGRLWGVRRGLVFGAFVGGSVGAIAAPFLSNETGTSAFTVMASAGGVAAGVGAAAGALVGSLFRGEYWQPYIFQRAP